MSNQMKRPFNHDIDVWGIILTVSGTYWPEEYTNAMEPDEASFLEIERVSVQGSEANIDDLLSEKAKARIESIIYRIEDNQ